MRKSQFGDELIVRIVRESHAHGVVTTSKKYKVSSHTIYLWRKKYGDMGPSQVSELKRIMQENARLKKLVAERDLEFEVLKEIASKRPKRSAAGRCVWQLVQAVMNTVNRGLGQRRAAALLGVSRSMLTYRPRQPIKDEPVRAIIGDVVAQHPKWGKRLVYG